MRIYPEGDPIRMRQRGGQPHAFVWKGFTHVVETIEDVREPQLDWWAATGEIHRRYWLVTTNRGLIAEVYEDTVGGGWYVGRVFD